MTPAQKKLVQATWERVIPIADAAAAMFYARLFLIDPTTRPLFRTTNMTHQRKKLLHVIGMAVAGLDKLETLAPAIEDLGRGHAGHGVTAAHYDSIGAALLWTLEQGLGSFWTAEAKAAWTEAYGLLSRIMRRAQHEAMAEAA